MLGWRIAGAFQDVLHYSNDPAPTELSIWSAASVISLFFTIRLTAALSSQLETGV